MSDVFVTKKNDVYLVVHAEESILRELSDIFCFDVEGAQFSPAYKNKKWDGKIRLFNRRSNTLYMGLLSKLIEFCHEEEYSIDVDGDIYIPTEKMEFDDVKSFYENVLNIHSGGKKISPRDPQVDALSYAIPMKRATLVCATASGKSLIIYALIRYLLHAIEDDKKILLVVPTVGLVHQMYGDFEDYSSEDGWDVSENCHKIYQGQEKYKISSRVVISTHQSIYDEPAKYFEMFGAVIGDECHQFKAKTLKGIMEKLKCCPYRYGFTGTLQDAESHKWIIEGSFGPACYVVSTIEMINMGHAPTLEIYGVILNYPMNMRVELDKLKRADENKNRKYAVEKDYIFNHQPRTEFLIEMCNNASGNTLVLFERIKKYGKDFFDELKKTYDGKAFFVYGDTEGYEREEVRKIMEREKDAIIVASYGVFSTGVSIKNLHNLIFAESPGKKKIRTIQSIGRLLRQHETKEEVRLFDIVDDLSYKDKSNYMIDHFTERISLYINEGHEYEILQEDLE